MVTLPNGYFTFEASSGYVAAQAHFQVFFAFNYFLLCFALFLKKSY